MLDVKLLSDNAIVPKRGTLLSAGLDLVISEGGWIYPGSPVVLSTDVAIRLPANTVGLIKERSSFAKIGITVSAGVIDEDYRGPIKLVVNNNTQEAHVLSAGARIAQLLIVPIEYHTVRVVETLGDTARGDKGFGSTGV